MTTLDNSEMMSGMAVATTEGRIEYPNATHHVYKDHGVELVEKTQPDVSGGLPASTFIAFIPYQHLVALERGDDAEANR